MNAYTGHAQTTPIEGTTRNNAGGQSYEISDMERFMRFLILGSSGGTYYTKERDLTKQNMDALHRLIKNGQGKECVDRVVAVSVEGRAGSNDPALFALSILASNHTPITVDGKDDILSRYAFSKLQEVARTGTHILHFVHFTDQFRGHGHVYNRALKNWYQDKAIESLCYQMVKYQNRDQWTQRDILRLAKPKPDSALRSTVYRWVTKKTLEETAEQEVSLRHLWAYEQAKKATSAASVASLIREYNMPREAVPTAWLNDVEVWNALLEYMPMEATLRNLATMTKNGTLQIENEATAKVIARLNNAEAIRKARLHPIKILAALKTYAQGHGVRGSASWTPIERITRTLNEAFYLSFGNVVPTGKRYVLALDISGSMSSEVSGVAGLSCREAAAAMAMVTARTEENYHIMGFGHTFQKLDISPRRTLDEITRYLAGLDFQMTNCALPMLWALENDIQTDVFCVYTDSETYAGNIHPKEALDQYRNKTGIDARLVVVGMNANEFSIADPLDRGMMDVVGFDTNAPQAIQNFVEM